VLADEIRDALAALENPERGAQERRYLKSDLRFLGTGVPAMRKATLAAAKRHELDHDVLVAAATALWDDVHEHRSAAVELLGSRTDLLGVDDLPFLEELIRTSRTWALVDDLAARVVGPITGTGPTLDRWVADDDFWVQRAALLALLIPLRQGGGDWDRFARYADALLDERELFLRKAIGWILRDTARKRPDLVHAWCLPRAARMSGVTYREVVKHLTPQQRQELAVARQG
jgi:3-methyladenine DNA glycosylase AlkD